MALNLSIKMEVIMNVLSTFKIKLATVLLALAFCATDAMAMNPAASAATESTAAASMAVSSSSSSSATSIGETKAIVPMVIRKPGELKKLLYAEDNPLYPMPPELLDIIVEYDSYDFKGVCVKTLDDQGGIVRCLIQLTNGKIASGSDDGIIKIWDLESSECIKTLTDHMSLVECLIQLTNDPYKDHIVSGSHDGTIKIWNLTTGACVKTLNGHTDAVLCLIQLADGRLASGSGDWTIKIWDPTTGACVKTLTNGIDDVKCLIQLTDGRLTSSSCYTIKIWDLETGTCVKTLINRLEVWCLIQLANGQLASCSCGGTIKIWDLNATDENNACVKTLTGHEDTVVQNLIELTNGYLASCSHRKHIMTWDTERGIQIDNGHRIDAGPDLIHFKMFDGIMGTYIPTFYHDSGTKHCLIELANGWLASGSFDGTIKIWK
jgi:WD40 repeat protein